MNEDGSLGISHNASQEGQTPTAKPVFSSGQEGVEKSSADASTANDVAISHDSPIEVPTVNNIAISHDSLIEAPTTTTIDTEPVDIFASPEERAAEAANTQENTSNTVASNNPDNHHIANSPFSSRNHFQSSTNTTDPNIPQFFNDAIIANTPIEQPKKSKKGLIIGAIIGCVVLILTAIIIIIIIHKQNSPQGTSDTAPINKPASANLVDAYNRFFNYLVFGKDSNESAPDSELASGIYADLRLDERNPEKNKNYFSSLNEKLESFIKSYNSEYPNNTITGDEVQSYYYYYATAKQLSRNDIDNEIVISDINTVKNIINETYPESVSGTKEYKAYVKSAHDFLISHAEIANIYKDKGCIYDNNVDAICIESTKIPDNMADIYTRQRNLYEQNGLSLMVGAKNELKNLAQSISKKQR